MRFAHLGLACFILSLTVTAASAATFGLDGNFETEGAANNFGGNSYCYFSDSCTQSSPWTGSGSGIIVSGSAPWGSFPAPAGENYYGFVQLDGSLTNTFTATATGNFTLSWLDTNRGTGCLGPCGLETYNVSINGIDLGTFTPSTIANWESQTGITDFALISGTSYTILFQGADIFPPDSTAFINDLVLSQVDVPEPITLSVFGVGLAGAAALRRRKKAKA